MNIKQNNPKIQIPLLLHFLTNQTKPIFYKKKTSFYNSNTDPLLVGTRERL